MSNLKELRRRLEVQGFLGLSDSDLRELGPWMRFTPLLNTVLVGLALVCFGIRLPLVTFIILIALAVLMGLGSMLPRHPFDWVYNHTLRFWTHTKMLPQSGPRRRFIFSLACWWLIVTAWLFNAGILKTRFLTWAFAMACALMAMSLLLGTANLCVVSEILDKISGKSGKPKA